MYKRYFPSFKMLKQLAGAAAIGLLVMDVGATMAGKVFCDLNGNGIYDSGDEGIPGVIVRHCDKIKVTDANGDYSFDGTDINTAICVPLQGTSAQPRIVTVDTSTITGDCNVPCSPTSVEVPVIPAFGINFCFSKQTPPPPPTNPGTGTPGFWKNHPEAWPADAIEIGGQVYTKEQAIYLMQHPTKTDKTYNMFEQLVAAVLNVEIGNSDSCILGTLIAADDWLAAHPVGSGVNASSSDWTSISSAFLRLDDYNNGLLCAPSRD